MSITTKSRNLPKWHATPAPPPSPKILNLPRRHRRKQPKKASAKPPPSAEDCRGKLECLFDQERLFPRTVPTVCLDPATGESESREMVGGHEEKGEFSEEKWRFEAEILRAECNLLRIERDFALKKLERNRVQMGRTLQSAIQTLITGRNKICSGKSASSVMEEEIEVSVGQLKELQGRFTVEDFKVKNCCNLDKKATLLQRQLEKLGGSSIEKCLKEMCNVAEERYWMNISCETDDESFVSGHKSNDKFTDESISKEGNKYSGHCKAIVPRIVEQLRAGTEQLSQMQEMLSRVRDEIEELHASRDFWEDRALDYDKEIQSLHSA